MNSENKNREFEPVTTTDTQTSAPGFLESHPGIRNTLAVGTIGLSALGIGETINKVTSTPEEASISTSLEAKNPANDILANPNLPEYVQGRVEEGMSAATEAKLTYLQAVNDGDFSLNPTDIPSIVLDPKATYTFTVKDGGGVITDGLKAYREFHQTGEDVALPNSVIDAVNSTGENYVERLRIKGEPDEVQPGTVVSVTEVSDKKGTTFAIISDKVHTDPN